MRLVPVLLIVAIAAGAWNHFSARPVDHAAGILAPDDPVQIDRSGLPAFSVADYRIMPAATFSLQARVLSTEVYHAGREADLSPVDLALGWGPMSDSAVLDRLQISQGNRFYFYRWSGTPPIPPTDIVEHSANMHMIPANDDIKRRLGTVRTGQIVALSGYLVRVQAPDGWHWNSSMTRSDSGNGACELVWVQDLAIR
ncbi:hypothetical protein [Thiobacillus sp.]|uniref:hypothetical protein n=1 Tax=Thiobacillus sp. TaxID=924 RepID=UPI0017F22156|nr:hypothetical protein [Thiobacillus sp.]MBC2730853.1 hypothetical protein [Thiobacillus sp.]MBC2739590.1 hypothetical protein [Thiobacillus sp.]MBC2760126.1 hypothetical protein [Thiobacillus sp.]MBD3811507.1 hypothetical protein [Betaproteobacteria bacterium]